LKFFFLLLIYLLPSILLSKSKINDAFLNANIDAQLQFFHYNINNNSDAYATSLGGYLKYTTDTKNNFFASARFHTSNIVGDSLNKTSTSLFNNDNNGNNLTTISESFLSYKTKDRIMKIGNFMLNTPMMNDDTSRIVPWSYQGATYTGKVIQNTKVQVYYINEIRAHTSPTYKKESASGDIGKSGIGVLAFNLYLIDKLRIDSYYYYAPELYSTFTFLANYEMIINENLLFCLGTQYFNSHNGGKYAETENKNGGDDINLLALKASVDTDAWTISLNYSQNYGLSGIVKGYGGSTKVYTTSMIANGKGNYKPETWTLKVNYDLPWNKYQSDIALWFTNTKTHDSRGDSFNSYYTHYKHQFTKKASLYFRFENLNYTSDKSDALYFRAITKYEF